MHNVNLQHGANAKPSPAKVSKNHFDRISPLYEKALPPHISEHYLLKRVQYIKKIVKKNSLILDVGCGTGTMTKVLSDCGYRVFGIDQSIGMLRIANAKNPGSHIQARATKLPFLDEQYDLVITIATLHHFADHNVIEHAIFEMLRVLRSGGQLLIWDHNPRNPYWKLLMKRVPQDCGEERLIPKNEIVSILAKHHELIESSQILNSGFVPDFLPASLLIPARKIELFLEKIPILRALSAHNVVLVKRA